RISRTKRRARTLRANVWPRTRPPRRFARSHHQRSGTRRAARRLLHQPTRPRRAGNGLAHDSSGTGSRERVSAIGNGGFAQSQRAAQELIGFRIILPLCFNSLFLYFRFFHSARKNGFVSRSRPIVVIGPCPGWTIVASGKCINLPRSESMISSIDPPHRSVRPMLPANSVSPASSCGTRISFFSESVFSKGAF